MLHRISEQQDQQLKSARKSSKGCVVRLVKKCFHSGIYTILHRRHLVHPGYEISCAGVECQNEPMGKPRELSLCPAVPGCGSPAPLLRFELHNCAGESSRELEGENEEGATSGQAWAW